MTQIEILEHHQKVIASLDKQLASGKITQAEYDERKAKQDANTKKVIPNMREIDFSRLMQNKD